MPLLGKIVVIKRDGSDGTEFPLTASCLFGRKVECDIRIRLPHVSKEHCRIEFNENKELILTNLSSMNPTLINGEILQQSERLKDGDLITIIDRSFRFEYPPAPTPKKKLLSTPAKGETVKVLQDQQVKSTPGTTEKKKTEHVIDTCLKDGSNLPSCLDQHAGDQQNKASMDSTLSPFSDLCNMVKRDLANKSLWKSASLSNTPRPRVDKQELVKVSSETDKPVTPKSAQKKRRSSTSKPVEGAQTENLSAQTKTVTPVVKGDQKRSSEGISTPASQKKTPQKFTADQVAQQIAFESPSTKSPKARRSSACQTPENQNASQNLSEPEEPEEPKVKQATRTSPRANAGKRLQVQDVLQKVTATPTSDDQAGKGRASSRKHKGEDLPLPAPKRKRVSFGGQLSPELFDKRLPPNSPLRRGATPGRRSLGFSQKPHSLLRRASIIGLMGYHFEEDLAESPAKNASPKRVTSPAKALKTPSPAKALKTPSPAKKSSSPKVKTPSPKNSKTPPPSSSPSTPQSSRRLSNASVKSQSPSEESLLKTPTMRGRFSVSRISTPSPVHSQEKEESLEKPQECVTPRATPRRSSMKVSARKTPKSVLKSALDVVRSRRSGASRANLKVVSSWADIVKFGQAKPQTEGVKKTATKRTAVKQIKVAKPKTPAQRLINHTSTGHADSPASIVVGKAYLRSTRLIGAAPKVVSNVALFKKDMKMDEDLTGVSDIFKTPANTKRKSAVIKSDECLSTPLGVGEMTETSVMNTPEESGEMVVSPMSVASTAKLGCYNSEAVTRLLQDNQDGSLIEHLGDSGALSPSEVSLVIDMPIEDQIENKKVAVSVLTPQHKPAPSECLTGVKRLLRTPKQRAKPIEDLRGKLLKTPKEPKPPQEECLDGVKELLNTPKQDTAGLKSMTPKDTDSPVVCAVVLNKLVMSPKDKIEQEQELTGVKQLRKTPKQKNAMVEEDLTGIQQMMKTPKQKKQLVEEDLTGLKQMMKTPKQKKQPIEEDLTGNQQKLKTPKQKKLQVEEDLTGIQQMLKTPKQKKQPIEEDLTGIQQMMKTPKQRKLQVEEDLTGIQQMMKTPKQKKQPIEEDLTGIQQMLETPKQTKQLAEEDLTGNQQKLKTPKQKKLQVEEDLTGIQQMMKTPKQKKLQVEEDLTGIQQMLKTPKQKKQPIEEDLTGIQQMLETPKQTKQLAEEDLTGNQQKLKTPKQKKLQVEEDLTGIQQMMKTPKQKKLQVEEDLTGIQQMLKTPKQKKQPIEEDLTGIQQMLETPKQTKQLAEEDLTGNQQKLKTPKQKKLQVEEDLTGIQQMMKTPKQKKLQVEEDLTGIQQMMKTPKQKKLQVEEDLTGIQQMMKTPKQKKQPVENLVGVTSLLQAPKEKGEPVENDFGIDNLMKTPKQTRDEAVVDSTVIAEVGSVGSDLLPVEDTTEKSEEKEDFCLVEDMQNNTEAAVGLQMEMEETNASCEEVEEVTSSKVITNAGKVSQEAPLETGTAVEATPSLASPKQQEHSNRSSSVKKSRRGTEVQMAQISLKSQEPHMDLESLSEESALISSSDPLSVAKTVPSVRGRRGKSAIELIKDVSVQSPARKSTRGRIAKEQVVAQKSSPASTEDEQVAHKPRRGRKAEQDVEILSEGLVTDLKASAGVEASMKSPAPARSKRGRKGKHESEASVEEVGVASESAELQPSAENEATVKSNTRTRRGRTTRKDPTMAADIDITSDLRSPDTVMEVEAVVLESSKTESAAENKDSRKSTTNTRKGRPTKKEMLKTSQAEKSPEPTQIVMESDIKSSDVVMALDVVEPKLPESTEYNSKPKRGKATKKETPVEEIPKPTLDSEVLPEEHNQIPVVKSRRGRRVNPVDQAVANESNVETPSVQSEPKPEASAVRSSRGARNKQLKPQVEDAATTETITTAAVTEKPATEPVVKNVRGGRRTKQPKAQVLDDSQEDKPSTDSESTEQSEALAVRSTRGKRTAAVKDEPEARVKRGCYAASAKVPPQVAKSSRGRKPAAKSNTEEVAEDTTTVLEPVKETTKGTKVLESVTEETPLEQADSEGINSEEKTKKGRGRIARKTKVTTKDTSVSKADEEASSAEQEPQLKMSKKKEEPVAKDDGPSAADTKQLVHPLVKGHKGRGAKKQEEPEKKPEENVQPVRRGRAGTSLVSKHHEMTTCPKRGKKRKDIEVVAEETPDTSESLPKRKSVKGAGAEGKGKKTAAKKAEETSPVEADEPPKKEDRPVRGRRKATLEDVPPQAEDPVSDAGTRRGTRRQPKAETDFPSAPARRTRRK